jgi:hypothetical protein
MFASFEKLQKIKRNHFAGQLYLGLAPNCEIRSK